VDPPPRGTRRRVGQDEQPGNYRYRLEAMEPQGVQRQDVSCFPKTRSPNEDHPQARGEPRHRRHGPVAGPKDHETFGSFCPPAEQTHAEDQECYGAPESEQAKEDRHPLIQGRARPRETRIDAAIGLDIFDGKRAERQNDLGCAPTAVKPCCEPGKGDERCERQKIDTKRDIEGNRFAEVSFRPNEPAVRGQDNESDKPERHAQQSRPNQGEFSVPCRRQNAKGSAKREAVTVERLRSWCG